MSGTQAHHAGGTRARIGRAATGVVSSAAQFGLDRTDIADSMGHTAASWKPSAQAFRRPKIGRASCRERVLRLV